MKQLFIVCLLAPCLAFAQAGEVVVGDLTVQYDAVVEKNDVLLYYSADTLVLSEHESTTLVYKNDELVLEAHDTDGDGVLDAYLTVDQSGEVSAMTGPGVTFFERAAPVEFNELLSQEVVDGGGDTEADLVGSLDSITIPKYHNWLLYGFGALVVVGGGVWVYRKKKKGET
jgi:hypothetical protein